jgi:hypothetical protein
MSRYTDTSQLKFAATTLLVAIGRLDEHELWDGEPRLRRFIDEKIRDAAAEVNEWVKAKLGPEVERKTIEHEPVGGLTR